MMTGTIDGTAAFTSGKVKIDGDMGAAAATGKYSTSTSIQCRGGRGAAFPESHHFDQPALRNGPGHGQVVRGTEAKEASRQHLPVCKGPRSTPGDLRHVPRPGGGVRGARARGFVSNFDLVYFASPDPLTGVVRTPHIYAPGSCWTGRPRKRPLLLK